MKLPLSVKLKLAAGNTLRIIATKPLYTLLAITAAFCMLTVIIWSLNYQLVGYILTNPDMSPWQKLRFFSYGYEALFTSFDSFLSVSVISLAFLFGINIAVLVYALRRKTASARATGTSCMLLRSQDEFKDQTYFIYNIKNEQLPHILFPIGHLKKAQVKKLAEKIGLPNAKRKELYKYTKRNVGNEFLYFPLIHAP
jgi:hypothetical protein